MLLMVDYSFPSLARAVVLHMLYAQTHHVDEPVVGGAAGSNCAGNLYLEQQLLLISVVVGRPWVCTCCSGPWVTCIDSHSWQVASAEPHLPMVLSACMALN